MHLELERTHLIETNLTFLAHVFSHIHNTKHKTAWWLGDVVVRSRTGDSEAAGSSPTRTTVK